MLGPVDQVADYRTDFIVKPVPKYQRVSTIRLQEFGEHFTTRCAKYRDSVLYGASYQQYLDRRSVPWRQLLLVGFATMLLPRSLKDLSSKSAGFRTFHPRCVHQNELSEWIFGCLPPWNSSICLLRLHLLIRVVQGNARQRYLDHFLVELTLIDSSMSRHLPSHLMCLAVIISICFFSCLCAQQSPSLELGLKCVPCCIQASFQTRVDCGSLFAYKHQSPALCFKHVVLCLCTRISLQPFVSNTFDFGFLFVYPPAHTKMRVTREDFTTGQSSESTVILLGERATIWGLVQLWRRVNSLWTKSSNGPTFASVERESDPILH